VADTALQHNEEEEFQRELLLKGESIYGVYPMNPANRKLLEEIRKRKTK
jgi:hypothetical protein